MEKHTTLFWFTSTLACIAIQGLYSMLEMASVSFNKVRLQYYVSQGNQRAIWLSQLLKNPTRLFGTTLLCVNLALQIGSECSRELYQTAGFIPDLAALSQVILVLIFAELSPMFAARRYAEHVIMLGIPWLYASSCILAPAVDILEYLAKKISQLIGQKQVEEHVFLTRDELQKLLEQPLDASDDSNLSKEKSFDSIVNNIFTLHGKVAKEIMRPITAKTPLIPISSHVETIRKTLQQNPASYAFLYQHRHDHITAVVFARDIIDLPPNRKVKERARAPVFITESTPLAAILDQLRKHNPSIAIVLDPHGHAIGFIELENLTDGIFESFSQETDTLIAETDLQQTVLTTV
ncbi:MAG: conserved rane protein [Chlamydiales bacterium]|jgi:CBS domain containing-hemolysin-like protein|nr:conserved rane protein [Chlamydiales bacterium]